MSNDGMQLLQRSDNTMTNTPNSSSMGMPASNGFDTNNNQNVQHNTSSMSGQTNVLNSAVNKLPDQNTQNINTSLSNVSSTDMNSTIADIEKASIEPPKNNLNSSESDITLTKLEPNPTAITAPKIENKPHTAVDETLGMDVDDGSTVEGVQVVDDPEHLDVHVNATAESVDNAEDLFANMVDSTKRNNRQTDANKVETKPNIQNSLSKNTVNPNPVSSSPLNKTSNSALVNRKDLLNYLLDQKLITKQQYEEIKIEQTKTGKDIESIIVDNNILSQKDLYRNRAKFFKIDFVEDIFTIEVDPDLVLTIKKHIDVVKNTLSFPIDFDGSTKTLKIIAADFLNYNTIQFWRMTFNAITVEVVTGVPAEIEAYINNNFGNVLDTELVKEVRGLDAEVSNKPQGDFELMEQKSLESTSKTAKLVEQIIRDAALNGASDIHIEPTARDIRVRFRIDGVLTERFRGLSSAILPGLVTRIKILSHLRIDETRLPQDGRIFKVIEGKKYDIRVSTLPTIYGEKTVMRLLERSNKIPKIEDTGMRGEGLKRYLDAISLTSGIVLITGPTGSGKTTTLASTLARLNTPDVNIISVEDPVEVRVDGITQVQVKSEIGLTFAEVLRSILRQDPDIIMVGEIRDKETAHLAIRAALTGHLVLSTLHTNDAPSALPRLIDMGIEPYLVASTVKVVVAQRLVRALCMYSRKPYKPEKPMLKHVLKQLEGIPDFDPYSYINTLAKRETLPKIGTRDYVLNPEVEPPFKYDDGEQGLYFYKATPHVKCGKAEYKGRLGIFEVLKVTESIQNLVIQSKPASVITEQAKKEGMVDLIQDGFLRVLEGVTSVDEVLRVAKA